MTLNLLTCAYVEASAPVRAFDLCALGVFILILKMG